MKEDNRVYLLEWVIQIQEKILEGILPKDMKSIVLDGDGRDCAASSLWIHSNMAPQYELFFYDIDYSADIELRAGTTEEEIVKCFTN